MFLNSNSSKHEDRFYAILPHTKYSHYIKDIDKWKISNITDVILKLLEIIDLDDKITYLINKSEFFQNGFLPSFATNPKGFKISNSIYEYKQIYIYNITLKNKNLFITTNYYKIIESYDINMNIKKFPYKQIGLTKNDEIFMIEIPLALAIKDDFFDHFYSIIIKGNFLKNKWIAIESKEKDDEEYFKFKKEEIKTFNIY